MKKSSSKKIIVDQSVDVRRGRGRPLENKKLWRCVLRLPQDLAEKLKTACKAEKTSINMAVESVIDAWLSDDI